MLETVPASLEPASRPYPFDELTAPKSPKPTAAHPRAFRGTTYKPPTSKSPQATNLRPFLCDQFAAQDLLARLSAPHNINTGFAGSAFHDTLTREMSPVFIANLYPALREKSPSAVAEAHALFQRLGLERNEPLLACITALYACSNYTSLWCEITTIFSPDQQASFAGLLLITNACDIDPTSVPELAEIALEAANGPESAYRTYCLLRGLANGVDSRYLQHGFRLNDLLGIGNNFHEVEQSGDFPAETFHNALTALPPDDFEEYRWKSLNIWKASGRLSDFAAFINSRDWPQWDPIIAMELLLFYTASIYQDTPAEIDAKWQAAKASAETIEKTLARIAPERQWKFVDGLKTFLLDIELEDLGSHSLSEACAVLTRLCQTPFHPRRDTASVWLDFIAYFDKKQRESLYAASDNSFQQMEKSCGTNNTTNLVSRGTWALAKAMPAFTLECFLSAPTRLFRTGKTLGCLSIAERWEMVQSLAREPFMSRDIEEMGDAEVYDFIAAMDPLTLGKAIPKELRLHYQGSAILNAPRLAHYHTQMRRQWLRACLETMENAVYDRLARGFGVEAWDEGARHALQIQMHTRENRKALKKLLAAHWAGRTDYVREHPQTRQWLKEHPRLNISVWLSSVPFSQNIAPYGQVTISPELDPVEALKLGTYVGSCLGLGGSFTFSAAATVLDINKQVLYARDAKGTVIGRQVAAYAESNELVCFYVYPISASDTLRAAFAEYDRKFAAALGASLHQKKAGEEDYEIEQILSHGWWDDGADHDKYQYPKEPSLTPSS